jgi:hypothetical protein
LPSTFSSAVKSSRSCHLEGHPQIHSVVAERFHPLGSRFAQEPTHLGAAEEQVCGLSFQDVQVLLFGEVDRAASRELQDHPLDHPEGDLADDFQHRETSRFDGEGDGADVEKIAEKDGEVVPEKRIDRLLPPPRSRAVDDVVVDQGRGVYELRDGRIARPLVSPVTAGFGGKEEERRTNPLSPAPIDVATGGVDQAQLALDFFPDDLLDRVEVVLDLAEDVLEGECGHREGGFGFGGVHPSRLSY